MEISDRNLYKEQSCDEYFYRLSFSPERQHLHFPNKSINCIGILDRFYQEYGLDYISYSFLATDSTTNVFK